MRTISTFLADEDAATAIEYGLIAALVAIIAIVGFTTFGNGLSGLFNAVENRTTTVLTEAPI